MPRETRLACFSSRLEKLQIRATMRTLGPLPRHEMSFLQRT